MKKKDIYKMTREQQTAELDRLGVAYDKDAREQELVDLLYPALQKEHQEKLTTATSQDDGTAEQAGVEGEDALTTNTENAEGGDPAEAQTEGVTDDAAERAEKQAAEEANTRSAEAAMNATPAGVGGGVPVEAADANGQKTDVLGNPIDDQGNKLNVHETATSDEGKAKIDELTKQLDEANARINQLTASEADLQDRVVRAENELVKVKGENAHLKAQANKKKQDYLHGGIDEQKAPY